MTTENLQNLDINEIAQIIGNSWKNVYFGAVPYLQAMHRLQNTSDSYGADDAKTIVLYFLSNATAYRGDTAKAVKKELKRRFNIK